MSNSINPYQVSHSSDSSSVEDLGLVFDGAIGEDDYRKLLPRNWEWWLCMVLIVLLAVCLAFFTTATVATLLFVGDPLVGMALIAGCAGLAAAFWFTVRFVNPKVRARRALKRNPDLFGTARGELNVSGLRFEDGVHQYWFGPAHMLGAKISASGIRVGVDANPDRYLALTDRLFEAYDPKAAQRLRHHWAHAAATPESRQRPDYRALWDQIGAPPAEAIHFRGGNAILSEEGQPRIAANIIIAFFLLVPFYLNFSEPWTLWAAGILIVYGLAMNSKRWRSYVARLSQQAWNFDGWVTSKEVAIDNGETGVRMPANQLTASHSDDGLVLTTKGGMAYYLSPDQLVEPDQWPRLCAWLAASSE